MTGPTDYSHKIDALLKYASTDPIWLVHLAGIDLKSNHIYLTGEEHYAGMIDGMEEPGVEFSMANKFIKNLNILMRKTTKPILIHMKTCGGFWEEGMAMYDAIASCPNKVIILNYTHARSMSSIILQAADKRVMMPHSTFMFHQGEIFSGGTVKQFLADAEQCKVTDKMMLDIYVSSMKNKGKLSSWSEARIRKWLIDQMNKKEDVFLSAKQAVEYGFADEIFGDNGTYDWKALMKC